MCSELLRIPIEVGGVPLFGFGLLLLLWAGVGGYAIYRSGGSIDAWVTLAIGAAVIVGLPKLFPDGLPVRSYGLMMLLGCLSGLWLAVVRGRQAGIDSETIFSLAMHLFVAGIVGARLFYVIEYWDSRIKQATWGETLAAALRFTEGGLVVYGSLIGATAAFVYFTWRRKLPTLALADLVAPSLLIGLTFGRVGCLLNGCCYGGETDAPYAISFPRESSPNKFSGPYMEQASQGEFYGFRIERESAASEAPVVGWVKADSPAAAGGLEKGMRIAAVGGYETKTESEAESQVMHAFARGKPLAVIDGENKPHAVAAVEGPAWSKPVHPTQIYSAINAGLLCWLLWAAYPFRTRDGQVTALMLTLYPIARYVLEDIRIDESPVFGTGLSISQNVSLALLAVAALLWVVTSRRPAGELKFFGGGDANRTARTA